MHFLVDKNDKIKSFWANKMIKSKKGVSSHMEVMISFVIFISFVVFMLLMFKPVKLFSKTSTSLDIAESKILEYVSTNLSVTSLNLNFTPNARDCLYFNFSVRKIIIKDESENITNANSKGNKEVYFNATEKKFYKMYSEDNLEERKVDNGRPKICTELNESNYTLGVTRFYRVISNSSLAEFFQNYTNNYLSLKNELSLTDNFNVIVLNSSQGVIYEGKRFKPNVEVMAKNVPINMLDEDANLIPVTINIQVWD